MAYRLTSSHSGRHQYERLTVHCTRPGCRCRQSPDDDDACECRVSCGLLPTPAVVPSLSFDAAKLLVQAFISTRLEYCNSLLYGISDTCTDAYKPFKTPQHASSPTREGASTSRPSCSSYIGFQSANVFNSRSPCWRTRHCTTSCLRTWRKTANLCLTERRRLRWLDTARTYSAANQHTFWRSLIRCCWTSSMEQPPNPAARVGHNTRTISTSTQNASIWSLTAAAPSDSVFRALCRNWLTYLLTYLLTHTHHVVCFATRWYLSDEMFIHSNFLRFRGVKIGSIMISTKKVTIFSNRPWLYS